MYSIAIMRSIEYFLVLSYFMTKAGKTKRRPGRGDGDDDPAVAPDGTLDPLDIPGEPPGLWMGKGAEMRGLCGIVLPTHLKRVLRGLDPFTEEPIVHNAIRVKPRGAKKSKRSRKRQRNTQQETKPRKRRPGWDGALSAPKHVSALWAVGSPEIRRAIDDIQDDAVRATVEFATQFIRTRTRKGKNVTYPKGFPVVAAFKHSSSREGDPQLHTHPLFVNLVVRDDGTCGALESKLLFRNKMLIGAYYRQVLVHMLRTRLGVPTERHERSFVVPGSDAFDRACEFWSKRSKQIAKHCRDRGEKSAKAKEKAAQATKKAKELGSKPRRQLFERWKAEAERFGFTEQEIRRILKGKAAPDPRATKECVDRAIAELLDTRSHFSGRALKRAALYAAADFTVHPDDVLAEVKSRLESGPDVGFLTTENGHKRYTTKARLAQEQELLETAIRLSERSRPLVSQERLQRILKDLPTIRRDQAEALKHLATSPSSIRILNGPAGSGKTFVQRALAEAFGGLLDSEISSILHGSPRRDKSAIQKALTQAAGGLVGARIIAAAPTGKATDILAQAMGVKEAYTLDVLLGDFGQEMGRLDYLAQTGKQLARAARKKRTWRVRKPKPVPIDSNTVVVVDEASMMGIRHATMLLKHVEKAGATLILIGDGYQKPAVGEQSVFGSLCELVGHATLTETTRQNHAWARQAVRDLQDGNVEAALSAFQKHGCFAVVDDPIASIVWDWWHHAAAESVEDALIIAKTNKEVEALNDACQETLRRMNRLSGHPARIVDRSRDRTYRAEVFVGDRVIFTRNSNKRRDGFLVRNGTRGTVVGTLRTGKIAVRLDAPRGDWKVQLETPVPLEKLGMARLCHVKSSRPAEGEHFFADEQSAVEFVAALKPLGVGATLHPPKYAPRKTIRVSPRKFPHIRRGYAGTDCKAQGDTIPKTFVLLGGDSLSTYVQLSRHTQECRLYAPADLWNENEEGSRPLLAEMRSRPDLRLAVDLNIRQELANYLELTDRLYAFADRVFIRDRRSPFAWEPAQVIEQKNTLDLKVRTKHTGLVLTVPRAELKSRIKPELTSVEHTAFKHELKEFERVRELLDYPLQAGEQVYYAWPRGEGSRYVESIVHELHEDGSVSVRIGQTPVHIPKDLIPERIARHPMDQYGRAFLPKFDATPYVPRYDTRGENGNGAPHMPGGQTTQQTGGAVPPSAASLAPSTETDPANILKANARIPAKSQNSQPKPAAATTTQPTEPKSNILKANAKVPAASQNAKPEPVATSPPKQAEPESNILKANIPDHKRPLSKRELIDALRKACPTTLIESVGKTKVSMDRRLLEVFVGRRFSGDIPDLAIDELRCCRFDGHAECLV